MSDSFLSPHWHRVAGLKPRLRSHAQVHRHRYRGQAWYVVQDNASGRFHRFTPSAYLVIGLMDGRRTIDEIWSSVVAQVKDEAPTQTEVVRLLSQLHAADLLQSDVSSDAAELLQRYESHAWSQVKRRFGNPMSIKLPLWDPDRFLERTVGLVRPFLGWGGLLLWALVVVPALVLVGLHWPELTGNLADRVLAAESLLLLALVYPVVKVAHELGHAYATKAAGGEVHETGLLFLVFVPVPYVDASASAGFRSKARRAGVAAAGMIVETFLAALAMYVWVVVEPGLIRAIAFNVMLIAGVSTLVFNVNPLLRFDGYYILCDLIEVPNLGARANRFWGYLVERHLFGSETEPPLATPGERAWFVAYAPLAFAYRLVVLFGIVLFVAGEFFVVGVLIAFWGLYTGLVLPAAKMLWHVLASPQLHRQRRRAVLVTFGGIAAAVAGLAVVPFPLHTTTEGVVWMPDESVVRSEVNGFVQRLAARPGQWVEPGEPLITSEEPVLASEVRVLETQIDALKARLDAEQFSERVQAQLTRQEMRIRQANLAQAQERQDRLVIRSPMAGVFIVPRAEDMPGRYLRRGDVVGFVAPPSARIARVIVPQSDIELVRHRLEDVQMKLPDRPWATYSLRLVREVPAATDRLPSRALAVDGGGRVAADPREANAVKALERMFQFDLELPPDAELGNFGSRVYVRFGHGWEPLGSQWYRRTRQLLLARLNA